MAKRKKSKTSQPNRSYSEHQLELQKLYKSAAERHNERVRSWIRTKHYYVEPAKPLKELLESGKNPTMEMINKLERVRIKNLTKREKKKYERAYTHAYDEGKLDDIMRPKKKMLEPPTEQDYYEDNYDTYEEYEPFETEPIESEAEILADLSNFIDGVLDEALASVRSDMKELAIQRAAVFRGIYESAVYKVGNKKAFLSYLEDSSTHYRIVEVVTAGIQDSMSNESTYRYSLQEFAAILNSGAPLTAEQSETLEMYGNVDFDYTDTPYDLD